MPDLQDLSEAKRALLEKYLRGEVGEAQTRPAVPAVNEEKPTAVQDTLEAQNDACREDGETRAPVIPLQPRGIKIPLFYFHVHWMGGAFYCFNMARDLGEDQPFYVCEPYNVENLSMAQYPSLEEMATDYLKTMRGIQPRGPYRMAGFCGGGLIAFEIAQQLQAQGEEVDLLVLIEPRAGPAPQRLIWPRLFHGLIRGFGRIVRLSVDQQFNLFISLRHMYLALRYKQYRQEKDYAFWPRLEILYKDWMAKFVWTISAYNPPEYPGKAIYFWAEEIPSQRRLGWGKGAKAKEVEVYIIPGTHDTCRTEQLSAMTAELKACLAKVQRKN